jgi:hypothetical protein
MQSCGYGMRHTIRKLRSERAASSRADEEEGYQPVTIATVQLVRVKVDSSGPHPPAEGMATSLRKRPLSMNTWKRLGGQR